MRFSVAETPEGRTTRTTLEFVAVASSSYYSSPPPPLAGDPVAVLERHEAALAGLKAGLVDLEASPSYLMLANNEVGPETTRKVGNSISGAQELWPLLNSAEAALSHIRAHVTENGARGRHRDELIRLLSQRWIEPAAAIADLNALPSASAAPSVPRHRWTVAEVLGAFRQQYDAIRVWVTQISDMWLALLPRVDAARTTLKRLEAEVETLGVPEPLIGRALALAADLEARLVADPLGVVAADGPRLDEHVSAAASQVAKMRSGHDNLETDLASSGELLASLRALRARAEAAGTECTSKVVAPEQLIRVPSASVIDGDGGLADRLDELFERAPSVSWNQQRSLLDGWLNTARKLEKQLARAEKANRDPLQQREELRGRLKAYQAKISAVGKAEDLELTAIVDEARNELYTAPTDLETAAAAIESLAKKLRS